MSSDCATSSAGEDSCDTVIYMGSSGHVSDRDLTDNERPPSPNTMKIMKLKLSSSEDENTDTGGDAITPCHHRDSTEELRLKLSTLEEREEIVAPVVSSILTKKLSVGERAVNIVAPLVVKKELQTSPLALPLSITEETKQPPVVEDTPAKLPPPTPKRDECKTDIVFTAHDTPDPSKRDPIDLERNVSEKDLRNHEKRIAKLLVDMALSDDEGVVEKHNRRNKSFLRDGYASDAASSLLRNYRRSNSARDGYISAPEYSKPVQIVRGMVRKQQSLDESPDRLMYKDVSLIENETEKKTFLDDILGDENTSTPKQADLLRKTTKQPMEIQSLTVGRFSSIREASATSSSGGEKKNINSTQSSVLETPLNDISTEYLPSTSCCEDSDKNETINTDAKILNLNHIITVSAIPNFSVAKKPSLSNLPSSPTIPIRQNISRDTMLESGCERACSPRLERSYSREDTISVVSACESDAYDSDAYGSPTLNGYRSSRNPARLRYRWSTVYEEPAAEDKKSERSKHQKQTITNVDEAKPACVITSPKSSSKHNHGNNGSKPSLASRFTKSPKSEIKKPSFETPKSSKKYVLSTEQTPTSPKSKSKLSILLSPRSERKTKKSAGSTTNISPDKRMSGCSDASSGLDSGIHSQSSSLRSGEEIKVDDRTIERKEEVRSSKHRLWPFG